MQCSQQSWNSIVSLEHWEKDINPIKYIIYTFQVTLEDSIFDRNTINTISVDQANNR